MYGGHKQKQKTIFTCVNFKLSERTVEGARIPNCHFGEVLFNILYILKITSKTNICEIGKLDYLSLIRQV